jgi:hypothetical protein
VVLVHGWIAEPPQRAPARSAGRHALSCELLDAHVQVEVELFLDFAGDRVAPDERAEAGEDSA